MPSFSYSAALKIDDPSLIIETTHFLVHDLPSETTHVVHGSVPTDVDVLLASDLVISISGTLDRVRLSRMDISKSAVALHLKRYLETNSGLLGLNVVSNLYVDETDKVTKLTLTTSRALPQQPRPFHVYLSSIDLLYQWKSRPSKSSFESEIFSPFSSTLFLPVQSILDKAVEKLIKLQFVRRYPLIFGLWPKKLDAEHSFFAPIARSIINTIERSEDDRPADKCRRLLKSIAKNNRRGFRSSFESFHSYFQNAAITLESCCDQDAQHQLFPSATDEEMFSFATEKLFRLGVPKKMFKGSTPASSTRQHEDEEFPLINEPVSNKFSSTPRSPSAMPACEDLPISVQSEQSEESEFCSRAQLLKDHNIDEYFLDDEVNWNQDDSDISLWEATDSSLQLGSSEEYNSSASDLGELPQAASQCSPSTLSSHSARISKPRAPEPEQDLYYSNQSQEDTIAIDDSHNASPAHSDGLDTCRESTPFSFMASQYRATSANISSHSGSDMSVTGDLELEGDLEPLPLDEDEDDVMLCEISAVGESRQAFSIWEDW